MTEILQFPVLPGSLCERGTVIRRETAQDQDFLAQLYVSVRWEEFAATGWTDAMKIDFLLSQFSFQVKHYTVHYKDADFGIIEVEGQPAGRLYVFHGKSDIRIVDISLLPERRSSGLGTALLTAVQEQAAAIGKTVSIAVEKFNPAQRLYRRLGFTECGENGPYWEMIWFHSLQG